MEKEITCKNCKVKFTTKIIYKDSRTYTYKGETNYHCNLRLDKVKHRKCQLCRNMKKACDMLNNLM
jgi:hypothetical protein